MTEARRHFKANALQGESAVAAPLQSPDLSGKGHLQLLGGWRILGHIFVVEKALQGSLANLRMDLAVIYQLDPGLAHVVELVQGQISHPFEHRQEPALDLPPKGLLLSVLIRTEWQRVFKQHAQPNQSLFC